MRTSMLVAIVCAVACAQVAWAQGAPIYDRSYAGPMNVYGQPTFSSTPRPQAQDGQTQVPMNGPIPMAARGIQSAGSYLWSYMPAPVRGVESPYAVKPGTGQVNVNFVPGGGR
jgi:hypothetical protein